ncbi:MAG: hypothetical protein AAFO69_01990 [Bacteroidota bacterium]
MEEFSEQPSQDQGKRNSYYLIVLMVVSIAEIGDLVTAVKAFHIPSGLKRFDFELVSGFQLVASDTSGLVLDCQTVCPGQSWRVEALDQQFFLRQTESNLHSANTFKVIRGDGSLPIFVQVQQNGIDVTGIHQLRHGSEICITTDGKWYLCIEKDIKAGNRLHSSIIGRCESFPCVTGMAHVELEYLKGHNFSWRINSTTFRPR